MAFHPTVTTTTRSFDAMGPNDDDTIATSSTAGITKAIEQYLKDAEANPTSDLLATATRRMQENSASQANPTADLLAIATQRMQGRSGSTRTTTTDASEPSPGVTDDIDPSGANFDSTQSSDVGPRLEYSNADILREFAHFKRDVLLQLQSKDERILELEQKCQSTSSELKRLKEGLKMLCS